MARGLTIEVLGEKDLQWLLKRGIPNALSRGVYELVKECARILREDTKKRMASSDGGNWAPPSKWIKAKKGARKALAGQQRFIKSRAIRSVGRGASSASGYVEHRNPGDWDINKHHTGFTRPATGRRVTLHLKQPSHLGLPRGTTRFHFTSKRPSVVPARKIWPTEAEARNQIAPFANMWLSRTISSLAKSSRVHQLF